MQRHRNKRGGARIIDYDLDGDLDLFVAMYGPDVLWRNEGDGRFVEVEAGPVNGDHHSTSAAWGDYDNDGDVDVLVVPSLWHENSPLALLHAQAAGCPVVGSGVSGISELIHDGVNGLLFAPGDAKALARALTRLAMDRSLLAELGARAIRVKPMTEYVHELLRTYHDISMPEACV